jgi:hypothetical protein
LILIESYIVLMRTMIEKMKMILIILNGITFWIKKTLKIKTKSPKIRTKRRVISAKNL